MQLGMGTRASVTLDPLRYEFATTAGDEWDNNWLVISGDILAPDRAWQFAVPCLTTVEAKRISAWLRSVAKGGLTRVAASRGLAERHLAQAQVHLTAAVTLRDLDPAGAFTLT